ASTINTDGVDTFYSNNITIRNWSVTNGDDQISLKANTSNVVIENCHFYKGNGIAIGSIGQYLGEYEFVANVTANNVTKATRQMVAAAASATSTTSVSVLALHPSDGALTFTCRTAFTNLTVSNITQAVAAISQCATYINATGGCDTSRFQISNITWAGATGTVANKYIAQFQCSGVAPCPGISMSDIDVQTNVSSPVITCSNLVDPTGFDCTDAA
ncbi:hypothetical protein EWM64_g10878, partial [Hericium alpestre]